MLLAWALARLVGVVQHVNLCFVGLYQNVCECIASVHESTNPLFQGWCERDFKYEPGFGTKPVANVNKLFLEEVLGIRKDEEGNQCIRATK